MTQKIGNDYVLWRKHVIGWIDECEWNFWNKSVVCHLLINTNCPWTNPALRKHLISSVMSWQRIEQMSVFELRSYHFLNMKLLNMKRARQAKTWMVVNYSNCRDIYQHANIQMDFLHKKAFWFIYTSFFSYHSSLYLHIYFFNLLSKFLGEIAQRAKLLQTERTLVTVVWAHWAGYYSRQPSYYRLSGKHKVGFNHNHTPTLSQITELGIDGVFFVFTKNICNT